ncbi:glycosyl transferase [Comamonas sp. JC664]|uniref:glycosyl transferase n=1 Tax=Comamonas sp. JC664 TaxID=2801917 RepID=UPI003613927B
MVQQLLDALALHGAGGTGVRRVVLTLNLPEPAPLAPAGGWPFVLELRHNSVPQGFSANHNAALAGATEPLVCVLNPDVDLTGGNPFPALVRALQRQGVGLAYPMQVDENGQLQDSERELPTPCPCCAAMRSNAARPGPNGSMAPCGCCLRPSGRALAGSIPRTSCNCEDVELCLRLRLAGWTLARAACVVGHAGQRASHRRARHACGIFAACCGCGPRQFSGAPGPCSGVPPRQHSR